MNSARPTEAEARAQCVRSAPTWWAIPGQVIGVQLALLIVLGVWRRHALNPDGVAYLRIAEYYAHGQTGLALSGYWGPLLSWLMVPFVWVGLPPLVAGRLIMGLSAVFFLSGCQAVFLAFELPERWRLRGLWLGAVLSACWSVEYVTPDLLAAGLFGHAFALMVRREWLERPRTPLGAGVLWGAGYLAKAAMLPQAILVCAGMAVVRWFCEGRPTGRVVRGWLLTMAGFAVVAGAWIGVISARYHHLTISRSAVLTHAQLGPPDVVRFYPLDRGIFRPEPGRVTFWEDPDLPYPDWPPLANAANAMRQLRVIVHNGPVVLFLLMCINGLFPILLVSVAGLLTGAAGRAKFAGQRWWWALVPVVAIGLPYLAGYLLMSDQRYCYAAYPLMFVAIAGAWLGVRGHTGATTDRPVVWTLVLLAFLGPTLGRPTLWRPSSHTAGECGWVLAEKCQAAGVIGPVAGSGAMHGGRAGMYLAFHLGQPWYGDPSVASADEYAKSQARLIVVNRSATVCTAMNHDARMVDLDGRLFRSAEEAERFPLKIYELYDGGARQ